MTTIIPNRYWRVMATATVHDAEGMALGSVRAIGTQIMDMLGMRDELYSLADYCRRRNNEGGSMFVYWVATAHEAHSFEYPQ